jgi:hypothetical protein
VCWREEQDKTLFSLKNYLANLLRALLCHVAATNKPANHGCPGIPQHRRLSFACLARFDAIPEVALFCNFLRAQIVCSVTSRFHSRFCPTAATAASFFQAER